MTPESGYRVDLIRVNSLVFARKTEKQIGCHKARNSDRLLKDADAQTPIFLI